MSTKVDFEPHWEHVFPECEQPPERNKSQAARDFHNAVKEMGRYSQWIEGGRNTVVDFEVSVETVADAGAELGGFYDEAVARFKDAEHLYEKTHDILSVFLHRFRAITVPIGPGHGERSKEIKLWCRENLTDYETFLMGDKLIYVVYDEVERLHFKMRWG